MKVFLMSNPQAMMSLAFSKASLFASSTVRSFQRNFSSSVIWTTRGTSNTSWRYLCGCVKCEGCGSVCVEMGGGLVSYFVNMKGMRWPKCMDSEDGPRPVYR